MGDCRKRAHDYFFHPHALDIVRENELFDDEGEPKGLQWTPRLFNVAYRLGFQFMSVFLLVVLGILAPFLGMIYAVCDIALKISVRPVCRMLSDLLGTLFSFYFEGMARIQLQQQQQQQQQHRQYYHQQSPNSSSSSSGSGYHQVGAAIPLYPANNTNASPVVATTTTTTTFPQQTAPQVQYYHTSLV